MTKRVTAGDRKSILGAFSAWISRTEGSQLVEFAFVLPLLLILLVGIMDFAGAFTLKQKLNNAAREGVRFAISETCLDCTQTAPASTQAIEKDILTYLTNAGVNVCGLTGTSAPSPGPDPFASWVFSSSCTDTGGTMSIEIDRGETFVDGNGTTVVSSKVVIGRPYKWTQIIAPLVSGAVNQVSMISSDAIMEN